ncbi:MAG: response regulator [Gammaproteobacteria bacterium]
MAPRKVRYKLLFLALVPAIGLALVMGVYTTYRGVKYLDRQITQRGEAIARHFAPAAEYGVTTGNIPILRYLADSTLTAPDVVSVSISNAEGSVLYKTERDDFWTFEPNNLIQRVSERLFAKKNLTFDNDILLTDIGETASSDVEKQRIGMVRIMLTQQPKNYRQTELITNSALAIVALLLLATLFALYVARTISRPIELLTSMVNNIQGGDLGARAEQSSGGEIGSLQTGINQMAETIQNSHKRMALETRNATQELRKKITQINEKNYELEVARSRAEEANIAKSRFLANMSHELRTPMNAILGFTDLLGDAVKDTEHVDYLKTIRRSASDLLVLINEILDYSKIESGELKIDTLDFNIYELIDDVVNLLNKTAYDKYLDFLLYIDPRVPVLIHSDPLRIKQAIINLVSNAIKFTDKGHIALEVYYREADDAEDTCLEFRVIDTGIGIDDSDDHIFEPFVQRDDSLTREYTGTGLGLSITKYFVEKLDGAIGYSSRVNKGSTFWFTIPLTVRDAVTYHEDAGINPLNTLVYDRHRDRMDYSSDMLSAWGFPAKITDNIETFIKEFSSGKYDLVLYYLNRNDIDTDLQISMNHLASDNAIKFFLHNTHYYEDLSSITGFHHVNNVVTPYHLFNHIRDSAKGTDGDAPTTTTTIHSYTSELSTTNSLEDIRLLIADDNDINQRLMQVYVTRNGGSYELANDGESAIELAKREDFDLIVMDVHMPKTDGITAMQTIKAQTPDVPIIAVTADASSNSVNNYISQGFDTCLIKPVTERKLVSTVLNIVNDTETEIPALQISDQDADSAELPIIDITNAIRISGGNKQLSHELYNMLIVDLKTKKMQLMSDGNDTGFIKEIAHKISGGAKYCSAERLHYHASKLEGAIKDSRDDAVIDKLTHRLVDGINEVLAQENPYR